MKNILKGETIMLKRIKSVPIGGYDKKEVDTLLESMFNEIAVLRSERDAAIEKNNSIQVELSKAVAERDEILQSKQLITDTLFIANEKANQIILEATSEAELKKEKLEQEIAVMETKHNKMRLDMSVIVSKLTVMKGELECETN